MLFENLQILHDNKRECGKFFIVFITVVITVITSVSHAYSLTLSKKIFIRFLHDLLW